MIQMCESCRESLLPRYFFGQLENAILCICENLSGRSLYIYDLSLHRTKSFLHSPSSRWDRREATMTHEI